MLTTTSAIVLSVSRHSDRFSLVHTYSRVVGRLDFIMYGHRFRPMPLSLVEVTYDYRASQDLQRVRSLDLAAMVPTPEQPESYARTCVSLFVAEVLMSVFRHEQQDEAMYQFLLATVFDIRTCPDPENAHLRFLSGLSFHLGWGTPEYEQPHSRAQRQSVLRELIAHLAFNIEDFAVPSSLDVLTEIFD